MVNYFIKHFRLKYDYRLYNLLPMKIIYFLIPGFLLLTACNPAKKGNNTSSTNKESTAMAGYSAPTRKFIKELQQELENAPEGESFNPSEEMIQKYRLRRDGDTYYVGAMIKTDEGFDPEVLENNGVRTSTNAGNIITARVPIVLVVQLLHLEGINYIQIDEPVIPK